MALGPEHAEAHLNLATVYQTEHRLGEALREVTAVRRLAPDDPDAANTNAIICVEIGDVTSAREIWNQLIQFAPDYAPAPTNLSILNRFSARNTQSDRHPQLSYSHAEAAASHASHNGLLVTFKP